MKTPARKSFVKSSAKSDPALLTTEQWVAAPESQAHGMTAGGWVAPGVPLAPKPRKKH